MRGQTHLDTRNEKRLLVNIRSSDTSGNKYFNIVARREE